MKRVKVWLNAFRLRTLPLSLSGIIFGSFLAKANGFWDSSIFGMSLLTTILFQILSNLANDLGDHQKGADNENRVGPTRTTQSGEITPKAMKSMVLAFVALSAVSAGILIWISIPNLTDEGILTYAVLGLASILAAIMYTMGKKAYGYNGLGDVMVFLFFGLVSVLGVYGLYGGQLSFDLIFAASAIGLLSTAVLNLNNLRDHENDATVGKRTLVVKIGFEKGKIYHLSLIMISLTCLCYTLKDYNAYSFISLIFAVPLFMHVERIMKVKEPKNIDPELKKVALLTFGIALSSSILINL